MEILSAYIIPLLDYLSNSARKTYEFKGNEIYMRQMYFLFCIAIHNIPNLRKYPIQCMRPPCLFTRHLKNNPLSVEKS